MIEVLTPPTRPRESTMGPPELPGLIGAECWTMFSINRPSRQRMLRPRALTTPVEMVACNPMGLPLAFRGRASLIAGFHHIGVQSVVEHGCLPHFSLRDRPSSRSVLSEAVEF